MTRQRTYLRPQPGPSDAPAQDQQGFTLLELIVSLVLLSLLAAIFGMGLVAAMQSHEFSRANVRLAQKAQPAMARMARELMELTYIEARSTTGQHPYILYHRLPGNDNASVQRFGLHFHSTENVVLLYTNFQGQTPLNEATRDSGDILVDGVDNLTLTYLTEGGEWDGNDIQLLSGIQIELALFRPEGNGATKVFRTTIHLRNTRNAGGVFPSIPPELRDEYGCFINSLEAGR